MEEVGGRLREQRGSKGLIAKRLVGAAFGPPRRGPLSDHRSVSPPLRCGSLSVERSESDHICLHFRFDVSQCIRASATRCPMARRTHILLERVPGSMNHNGFMPLRIVQGRRVRASTPCKVERSAPQWDPQTTTVSHLPTSPPFPACGQKARVSTVGAPENRRCVTLPMKQTNTWSTMSSVV